MDKQTSLAPDVGEDEVLTVMLVALVTVMSAARTVEVPVPQLLPVPKVMVGFALLPVWKLVPVMTTVVPPRIDPVAGETAVTVGFSPAPGSTKVNEAGVAAVVKPLGLMMVTNDEPAAFDGETTPRDVELLNVT